MKKFSDYLEAVQLDKKYYGNKYKKYYGANKSIEEELKEIQEELKKANSATMKPLNDRKVRLEIKLKIQELQEELARIPMKNHIGDDVYQEKFQQLNVLKAKLEKLEGLK